jgi:hypothetical protein
MDGGAMADFDSCAITVFIVQISKPERERERKEMIK